MSYKRIEDRRAYHRRYMRERRAWLKSHHCCTECGKQDAYTLVGKSACFECNERRRKIPTEYKCTDKSFPCVSRKERTDDGACYICGDPVKQGSPEWDAHDRPFRVCEKHYLHLVEIAKKGREGRTRYLVPGASSKKAKEVFVECLKNRSNLKSE